LGSGANASGGGASAFVLILVISFAQGALIGFEREKAKIDAEHGEGYKGDYPGLRTFSLIAILGALSGSLIGGVFEAPPTAERVVEFLSLLFALFVLAISLLFALFRFFKLGFIGMTTYVAMLLSFAAGVLTGLGYVLEALSLTFLTSLILFLKRVASRLASWLTYEEYAAGLELGLIVFVLGPLIYAYNPSIAGLSLWSAYLFFIIVLGVSYSSYLTYRALGEKSLKAVSFIGGLVNSEATFTAVGRFAQSRGEVGRYLLYIVLGLCARGLTVLGLGSLTFMDLAGVSRFLAIVVPGYSVLALFSALLLRGYRAERAKSSELVIKSPLDWKNATRAAAIYLGVFAMTKAAMLAEYQPLVALTSFIGGLASATATTFSLLSNYPSLSAEQIALGTLYATVGALLNKIAYARAIQSREAFKEVAKLSSALAAVVVLYTLIARWAT